MAVSYSAKSAFARCSKVVMAIVGLTLGASLVWTGPAAAQGAATEAAAGQPQPDPERIAVARQIFDQVGSANLQAMSKSLIAAMQSTMTKSVSGLDDQRKSAMLDAVSESISLVMPKAVDATVDAMAQDFTVAQLNDMLAFYRSPTGRVMVHMMPLVMQQSVKTLLAQMPDVVRQMESLYCAKIACAPSDHRAFAALSAEVKVRSPT